MKKINLLDDYGIANTGNKAIISAVLPRISIDNENDVELNLTRCIIDYPATSMLIDKLLNELQALDAKKNLTITVSYLLPEQSLLNTLLGDSEFFEIEAKKEIPIDELRQKIESKVLPAKIEIQVIVMDRNNTPRKEFFYGNK